MNIAEVIFIAIAYGSGMYAGRTLPDNRRTKDPLPGDLETGDATDAKTVAPPFLLEVPMSTTSALTPVVNEAKADAQADAKAAVTAIGNAIDAIFGNANAQLDKLESDALGAAESVAEQLVPSVVRPLVMAVVATADPAAHALLSNSLEPKEAAALAFAKARVDATLAHL